MHVSSEREAIDHSAIDEDEHKRIYMSHRQYTCISQVYITSVENDIHIAVPSIRKLVTLKNRDYRYVPVYTGSGRVYRIPLVPT